MSMNAKRFDVFISYAHADEHEARILRDLLEEAGLRVWWDRQIAAGSDWAAETESAMAASAYFIVLISSSSLQSEWVHYEVGAVSENSRPSLAARVIPILIGDVELKSLPFPLRGLRTLQFSDLEKPEVREELLESLGQN